MGRPRRAIRSTRDTLPTQAARLHSRIAVGLVLVTLAVLLPVVDAALAQDPDERVQQARERAERAQTELATLDDQAAEAAAELAALRRQVDDERSRLRMLEGQLALAAGELESREQALADAEAVELEARGRLARAEEELTQGTRVLEDRLATTWMLGGDPGPALLVGLISGAESPSDLAINMHLLEVATSHQVGVVEEVTRLRERTVVLTAEARDARRGAEEARADADAAVEFAREARDEQAAVAARLEQAEARQATLLAELESDQDRARIVLAAVEADVEEAEAEVAAERAARERAARERAVAEGGGGGGGTVVAGGTCPVVGAVAGRDFSNDWGYPRPGQRSHEGTDIFADRGTPVVSLADGTVKALRRTDSGLGGLYVSIWVGPQQHWYYAHLDQVVPGLSRGDRVGEGQQLGTVGNSGNARTTPPHLHIGYYDADVAANPYPVLADRCR